MEDALREVFEGISGKALRREYRVAIASGSLPTPDTSSLPGVAEFASTLLSVRLEHESCDGDEVAAEHEEEDALVESKSQDDRYDHEIIADQHSELISQFDIDFLDSRQRGLGQQCELTAHIHEQLAALRAAKPRADFIAAKASNFADFNEEDVVHSGDMEILQDFIDGIDALYKSIERLEMKSLDSIKLMSATLIELAEQFVPEDGAKWRELSSLHDEAVDMLDCPWSESDGPLSAWFNDAQGMELRLRTTLDELSASDPRIQRARVALELEQSALLEIRAEQRNQDAIIPHRSFSLLCSEIAQDFRSDIKFDDEAIDALRTAAESHAVQMFQKANIAAIHAHRTYVKIRDLDVVNEIEKVSKDV